MSVTSTRRVSTSLSYSNSVRGSYDVAGGKQSFVETIDTANNVVVDDEANARGNSSFSRDFISEEEFSETMSEVELREEHHDNKLKSTVNVSPLLDNDDVKASIAQNSSVSIYGTNQAISSMEKEERLDNPYLKYFYENNEIIEAVDELV